MEPRNSQKMIEYRDFELQEMRADNQDGKRRLVGYTAVFDQEVDIAGYFREVFRQGSFAKTLQEYDQVALWNHDTGAPLARKSAGTLALREDEHGLHVEIELNNTSWADDVFESVNSGVVKGMSIGFSVLKADWSDLEDTEKLPLREIKEAKLYESSPVTFPAYPTTEIQARAIFETSGLTRKADRTITTSEPDGREVHSADSVESHEPDAKAEPVAAESCAHSEAGNGSMMLRARLRLLEAATLQLEVEK